MNPPRRNEWLAPQSIIGVLGMAGMVIAFWVSFDGRIRDAQNDADNTKEALLQTRQELVQTRQEIREDIREINRNLDNLVKQT